MKKKVLAALLAGVMVLGLVGCGGSGGAGSTGTSDSTEDGGNLLIWYNDYSAEEALENVIEAFKEENPNIEVDYEIKAEGDYYSILSQAIQSNDGPDLFWTNGTATINMIDYAENGALEDLSDKVDYGFIKDNSETAMDLTIVDDKNYSVPWLTLDTRAVYYNKDMFEENGWKVPETFSEFEALLAEIKEVGITPISMAQDEWSLLFAFEPILAGFDAEYSSKLKDYTDVTATDDAVRDCMQLMVDWGNAGYFGDNWSGVIENSAQILAFTTGKAAMNIAGSWDMNTISSNNPDLNYGAFVIPSDDGVPGLVGTAANGLSVSAKSSNMDAATKFADFCATKEAQTIWVQTMSVVSATEEIESSNEIAREITESGKGTVYRSWQNVLSSHSSTGNASTVWGNDFTKVFSGEMTVDEFCDEIAEEME